MPRALFLCTTIVAAFQLHPAAAAPNFTDAPLTPGVIAAAQRFGLDAARDRARFIPEIIRLLYTAGEGRQPVIDLVHVQSNAAADAISVPVPLSAALWDRAVFRHPVPADQLVATILGDRRAALLCRGLAGLDDETLAYFVDHPTLITFIYERAAPAFGAFADALQIRDGRVVPRGGDLAVPLWENVLHQRVTNADEFTRVLFGELGGRLSYPYALIASVEAPAASFALGAWIADEMVRIQRFSAFIDATLRGYREWHPDALPFSRPLNDLGVLLLRIRADASGRPLPPADRSFWARVFDTEDDKLDRGSVPDPGSVARGAAPARRSPRNSHHAPDSGPAPIDAAWLVETIGGGDMYARGERLDALAFGQRVFVDAGAGESDDSIAALKEFAHYRMLMLTLERVGIRAPRVYAATLRSAAQLADGDPTGRFWGLSQFQGSLALVARMRRVGTISTSQAEALVQSLTEVKLRDESTFDGGMSDWMRTNVGPMLPPGPSWDARLIAALAGPAPAVTPRVFWEGQAYRIDLPFAEQRRLEIVRDKQGGHTLDLAFAIGGAAGELRRPSLTTGRLEAITDTLKHVVAESAGRLRRPAVLLLPPAVDAPRDGVDWMTKAVDDLTKITRAADTRRAAKVGASLQQLSDITFADALLSFTYAADIGDPDGSPLLGGNVALRHDFGFGRRDASGRARTPWAIPRQDFMPGVPWHITGSLLGLDIALAPLSLKRLSIEGVAEAPKLTSVEREALAVGVNLLEPSRLTDADRDALAAAITRGRDRVRRLQGGTERLDDLAETLGLDGWRRREMSLMHEMDGNAMIDRFSLTELLLLGGGAPGADLDAWGAPGVYAWACVCTRFPAPRTWRILAGRPQMPLMAASLAEVNLKTAMLLAELTVPAVLARPVLASAMQDFIDGSSPTDANDWWTLAREAAAIRRQQFEDYVAAAAAIDGPLVPEETESSR